MPQICLSYRRADTMAIAGRIFDRLATHGDGDTVFMDIEHIPFGRDFRRHIDDVLKDCDLLIAIVGPQWLGPRPDAAPRITEKDDPVRVEIQTALRRGINILPVLVEDARMPLENQLPRSLRRFASLNALEVESGRDFGVHMERLIKASQTLVPGSLDIPASHAPSLDQVPAGPARSQPGTPKSQAPQSFMTLLAFLFGATFLLVLAHYLIVMRLDLSPVLLRVASVLIPLAAGFAISWPRGRNWAMTLVLALGIGVFAVAIMLTVVGLVDGTPIIPATTVDWLEALEYFATIVAATLAGHAAVSGLRYLGY